MATLTPPHSDWSNIDLHVTRLNQQPSLGTLFSPVKKRGRNREGQGLSEGLNGKEAERWKGGGGSGQRPYFRGEVG